jgi:hypothetical protein
MIAEQCACPNGSYGQKHTPECYEAQIERLNAYIEDILTKDRIKTREINILVPENRKLREKLERIERLAAADATGCDVCVAILREFPVDVSPPQEAK